jgi:CorA-like Mg2+ transporter protein
MTTLKLAVHNALNDKHIPANLKSFSVGSAFITEEWVRLVEQRQEVISETVVPDRASLPLLRTMIKRKHMFSEIKRTFATVCESITAPELNETRDQLWNVAKKLDNWIRDLESTISLTSNYLSLDESQRAITHSTRTAQLTVLAFVFIPSSAVASASGMNVNLLTNNPPIYWFAGIGGAVALVTFLYVVFFQQINQGLALTGLYSFSLALDIIFLILKIIALAIGWVVLTLGSPISLIIFFVFVHGPKYKTIGYFSEIVDAAWFLCVLYWDKSVDILQWAPPIMDIRLKWRVGKKVPELPNYLEVRLDLTPRKDGHEEGQYIVI